MQVLNLENQWTLLTALETHLLQGVEGAGSDRFWRERRKAFCSLFHAEQLEEIGADSSASMPTSCSAKRTFSMIASGLSVSLMPQLWRSTSIRG